MTLRIGRAIGRGIRRTLNPVGLVLTVLTFLYTLVVVASVNTAVIAELPTEVGEQVRIGLTLPVSSAIAELLVLVGMLVGTVVFLAATRAFTRGPHDRGTLSATLFTRRMGRALLSAVVANVFVFVAVLIGFVLLFVPGIFLAVSFVFVTFAIGVDDTGPLAALGRSWRLASGNRWRLLALVLVVGITTGLLGGISSVFGLVDPAVGQVVSLVITAPLTVLGYGILADAYVQVRETTRDSTRI